MCVWFVFLSCFQALGIKDSPVRLISLVFLCVTLAVHDAFHGFVHWLVMVDGGKGSPEAVASMEREQQQEVVWGKLTIFIGYSRVVMRAWCRHT